MNARSSDSVKCSRKARELKEHVRSVENEIESERTEVKKHIATSAQTLTLLPELTQRLVDEGRGDRADKLIDFSQTIAKDVDKYIADVNAIDKKFDEVKSTSSNKVGHIARRNVKCMAVGREYRHLNERIVNSLLPSVTQMLELADITVMEDDNKVVLHDTPTDKPI